MIRLLCSLIGDLFKIEGSNMIENGDINLSFDDTLYHYDCKLSRRIREDETEDDESEDDENEND